MRRIVFDYNVKNNYDTLLKVAGHCFFNALMAILGFPIGDYELVSCEIYSPGKNIKTMDLFLKGPEGYFNVEFHKGSLTESLLERDMEYLISSFLKYRTTINQRIVLLNKYKHLVREILVAPFWSYKPPFSFIPDIDGSKVLNSIKTKLKTGEEIDDVELLIFSILPLTNHGYEDESKLVCDLCNIAVELDIGERYLDAVLLCMKILIEIYVEDEDLKTELTGVITMTGTFMERYEKNLVSNAVNEAVNEVKSEYESLLKENNEKHEKVVAEITNKCNKAIDERNEAIDERDNAIDERNEAINRLNNFSSAFVGLDERIGARGSILPFWISN